MKWFKDSFSRTVASIMAILPTVSWSSACNTSDTYGCPTYSIEDDIECCQSIYENQVYEKLCIDLANEQPSMCERLCNKNAQFIKKVDCVINTCGEQNANEASDEWKRCADASLKNEAQCKHPWNSNP